MYLIYKSQSKFSILQELKINCLFVFLAADIYFFTQVKHSSNNVPSVQNVLQKKNVFLLIIVVIF